MKVCIGYIRGRHMGPPIEAPMLRDPATDLRRGLGLRVGFGI